MDGRLGGPVMGNKRVTRWEKKNRSSLGRTGLLSLSYMGPRVFLLRAITLAASSRKFGTTRTCSIGGHSVCQKVRAHPGSPPNSRRVGFLVFQNCWNF